MSQLAMFILCIITITLLSRVRIVRVPREDKVKPEDKALEGSDNYIRIVGNMERIRQNNPNLSDAQILTEATEKFRDIFIGGMKVMNHNPEKIDEFFDIRVYRALNNSNDFISEAFGKNEEASVILKALYDKLDK